MRDKAWLTELAIFFIPFWVPCVLFFAQLSNGSTFVGRGPAGCTHVVYKVSHLVLSRYDGIIIWPDGPPKRRLWLYILGQPDTLLS